jgi:hypothetical protein
MYGEFEKTIVAGRKCYRCGRITDDSFAVSAEWKLIKLVKV